MGGKHLKRQRAEKSKVQLKKKILPKGQNITNTTFKVKKIVTVEQLKKVAKDEPVSNWNVPFKELLIRLNHHNYTTKLNSLNGLRELLIKYPDILRGPLLKSLINKLLELLTDEEHKVRVTTMNLLSFLFELIPPASVVPFHEVFIVYLGCAMTHRNASVQQDSLKFIDVLLTHASKAIKLSLASVTRNFIRILKSNLLESHSRRTASESKSDLEQKKTKMLLRFYQFLSVGYSNTLDEDSSCTRNIDVTENGEVNLRTLSDCYKKIPNLSLFKSFKKKDRIESENDAEEFQSICSLIVPLVFDTWREFAPSHETFECALMEEVGELLSVLLDILLLLYEKAAGFHDKKLEYWFTSNYGPSFEKSFMLNFPFVSKAGNGEFPRRRFNTFTKQNLVISYLSYSFKLVHKRNIVEGKIEDYLLRVLTMKNPEEVELISKIFRQVLKSSKNKKPQMISQIVNAYRTTNSPELQQCISKTLAAVVLEDTNQGQGEGEGQETQLDDSVRNWIKSLPDRLRGSQVFKQEIETLLKLVNKPMGSLVLKELDCKAEEIIKNLPNIKIVGLAQLEGQKIIANILYRCNRDVLEKIMEKRILESMSFSQQLRSYIIDIFSHKINYWEL